MQLPLCYNPNITKWPNIGTVFWATVCQLAKENEEIIISVATNNMAVTRDMDWAIEQFKDEIKKLYNITNLGNPKWILGMEIKHNCVVCTISINQKAYIESMATKFRITTAKPIYIPMLPGEFLNHHLYLFNMPKCQRYPTETWLVMFCGLLWSLDLMPCSPQEFFLN